ncbi:TPA: AAA family ATPase [Raoultella ornithinolytica]|nr:AAA family ATPase [Raoultella ornithinolytica]
MRPSPNELQIEMDKVRDNRFNQYVKSVRLKNVRGFIDEKVEFRSPVTALIGTNGGGKSTILGAVALGYKSIKPGQFFPKAFIGDESMSEWEIDLEMTDKPLLKDKNISRTAKFKQSRWRRDNFPQRQVVYIEIQRTVPAGELSRFKQFIAGDKTDFIDKKLLNNTIKYAGAVLDKDLSHYRVICKKSDNNSKMYVGAATTGADYSQFHFGAGEASIIETIDRIENADDNALVLIEELENGLHPVAVRALVNYLLNVSKRKKLQIVFTTHSQEAVNELPAEAVWASINKRVWNGKLNIESLRAITGTVHQTRVVYVEDNFAKEWVENAIGWYAADLAPSIKVYAAGGYPNLLKVNEFHNLNETVTVKSVALVDGDVRERLGTEKLSENAAFLGDTYPDVCVFHYIAQNIERLVSVLRQRCQLVRFDVDRINKEIKSVLNSACDHHVYFSTLSQKLDFTSELLLRTGMMDIFNEENEAFWERPIELIRTGG